ncbi:50S ribosomal protein L3 [Halobacteriovorax marinus]|uniref:Large ribosomal subunit protein uL3 n=1 Tax=Halobacteriovorax marinus TaxID=97084 RepID=A0A1Y5F2Z5_9BACT|nr:50S ribosomal protein L3 [Halobacteriovorax marinus]
MTRVFDENGNHVPVTVVKLIPNIVTQVKTVEVDGYEAYQVGYGEKRESLVKKPIKGHLKKAEVKANLTRFAEIKNEKVSTEDLGKEISLGIFTPDAYVDVTGVTKGKGFQGVMKKYNFAGGPAAHGSHFHRTTGSIGNRATPGRVFKLKKMPGHMGAVQQTTQNIKVVEVNTEKGYMLLRGSVPGSKNGFIRIAKALKK